MNSRVKKIIGELNKLYPNPKPSLNFKSPFELMVAAILAAQCTDARVNIVTEKLFRTANTPEKILKLGESRLISYIKSTGFYRAKAKSIMGSSKMLVAKFKGKMPRTLEELQTLPGVGRKTASVVLAQAFHIPAFPVDRHVLRVANRLGLSKANTADKTDLQLRKIIPQEHWISMHMQIVYHGRKICRPKPKCAECTLFPYCPAGKKHLIRRIAKS